MHKEIRRHIILYFIENEDEFDIKNSLLDVINI